MLRWFKEKKKAENELKQKMQEQIDRTNEVSKRIMEKFDRRHEIRNVEFERRHA